jgi:hypothetical protein
VITITTTVLEVAGEVLEVQELRRPWDSTKIGRAIRRTKHKDRGKVSNKRGDMQVEEATTEEEAAEDMVATANGTMPRGVEEVVMVAEARRGGGRIVPMARSFDA